MSFNHRQSQRDLEAFQMATPKDYDPLKVAIDTQLALERYKINEEMRAREEFQEKTVSNIAFGIAVGLIIMYIILKYVIGHV